MAKKTTDGTLIPEPSNSVQYIKDVEAGWLYIVRTNVSVHMKKLSDFDQEFLNAQRVAQEAADDLATMTALKNELGR